MLEDRTAAHADHTRSGAIAPDAAAHPIGRRGFIVGGAAVATTAAAIASMASPAEAAAAPARYVALTPLRLCDTRPGPGGNFGFTRVGSKVTRVKIAGRTIGSVTVPADATAAVFTVVGINRAAGRNYLSAYPAGTTWPGTSSVNMPSLQRCGAEPRHRAARRRQRRHSREQASRHRARPRRRLRARRCRSIEGRSLPRDRAAPGDRHAEPGQQARPELQRTRRPDLAQGECRADGRCDRGVDQLDRCGAEWTRVS